MQASLRRWRAAAVLMAFGVAVLAAAPWRKPAPSLDVVRVGPHLVARGVSYEGDALPAEHLLLQTPAVRAAAGRPVAPAALSLKRHCAWGDPGRDPYQGSVEEALNTAQLPPEVVQAIAAQVKAGRPDDRLTITNASIRGDGSGQEFNPKAIAMTFGRTLCVGTRVNFKRDHFERASLYQAADYSGKVHSVMVPDVCGNVSVLGSEDQLAATTKSEAVLGDEAQSGGGVDGNGAGGGASGNNVSEPPGWATVGLALAIAAAIGARRRGRRDDD